MSNIQIQRRPERNTEVITITVPRDLLPKLNNLTGDGVSRSAIVAACLRASLPDVEKTLKAEKKTNNR